MNLSTDDNYGPIAVIFSNMQCGPFNIVDSEPNANPHTYLNLFVTAPEMLELLKEVLQFGVSSVYYPGLWHRIAMAIDKAEGK